MLSRLESGVGLSPLSTSIGSLRLMGPLSPEMGTILPDLGPLKLYRWPASELKQTLALAPRGPTFVVDFGPL